jgi:hypothetical protein
MAEKPNKKTIRIELTDAQTEQVRKAIGREFAEIELTLEELEPRIALRLASNHNESLLLDS